MATFALLAVGDELLDGLVREGNCTGLSSRLRAMGHRVLEVRMVPDEESSLRGALLEVVGRVDFAVISGGLGPTHDDRTRSVLAEVAGSELVWAGEEAERVLSRYEGEIRSRLEGPLRSQLMVPRGARAIYNPLGTALGVELELSGTRVFALPGVPREFEAMADLLLGEGRIPPASEVFARHLLLVGVTEGELMELASDLHERFGVRLSILPSYGYLRLFARCGDPGAIEGYVEALRSVPRLAESLIEGDSLLGEIRRLCAGRFWLSVAESCTAGAISRAITDEPASDYFRGGVVAYSDEAKVGLLGVDPGLLEREGAFSAPVAESMAEGVRRLLGADLGLSATGIAGPSGGTPEKPVGLVFLGISSPRGTFSYRFHFGGDRGIVRARTVNKALEILWRELKALVG